MAIKLSSIPHLLRDLNRSIEILTILSKYRLAGWIDRFEVDLARNMFRNSNGVDLADLTFETRVRLALIDLGPTFVKFGQMLSTRPDIVGAQLAQELSHLQSDLPADPPEAVRALVESELGQPLDAIFSMFDEVPIASASIGQVHRARLRTGDEVVVKVQHIGIRDKIDADLEVLTGIAQLLEQVPEFKNYRPRETAAEFQRALRRELDFGREERNLEEFIQNFSEDTRVCFPRPYPQLSTGLVLTMEWLDGVKICHVEKLEAMGSDLKEIARRGSDIFLAMIFEHGSYHADPHPGNILVLPGNVIGVIDCGMVGRMDEKMRGQVEEIVMAITQGEVDHLAETIMHVGRVPPDLDEGEFHYDLSEFVSLYTQRPMQQIDLGKALNEMTEIIRKYHILLPNGMAMLIKVLVMLEGTARRLDPEISLVNLIEPYQKKLIWRRFNPMRQLQKFRRIYQEWEQLAEQFPRGMCELINQMQSGRFDVQLEHKGLEPSVNRLVLGMLSSALFLGSSLLLAHEVPPLLQGVSVFGFVGAITSVILGLRLFWAIRKSGHLDRKAQMIAEKERKNRG
ncbi:Ubiquinone biosynthesis monooxygenase UbiB [Planctomycetales bacterium 10988]|nr:Ubiquinone biosynthesis monooxygenase UbiB [Planctomycetales bacterium 10988]